MVLYFSFSTTVVGFLEISAFFHRAVCFFVFILCFRVGSIAYSHGSCCTRIKQQQTCYIYMLLYWMLLAKYLIMQMQALEPKMRCFFSRQVKRLLEPGAYLNLSLAWKRFSSHVEEDVHKSNQVFTWWTSPGEHCYWSYWRTVPYTNVTSFFTIFSPEFRRSLFHRCFLRLK